MSLVSASIVGIDLDFVRDAVRFFAMPDRTALRQKFAAMMAVPRDAFADGALFRISDV
jgi:hypothetical protein